MFASPSSLKACSELENFLDLTNAARLYPISRRTSRALVYSEKLKAYRAREKLLVTRSDIERLLTATPGGADIDHMVNEVAQVVGSGRAKAENARPHGEDTKRV